ncbi:MAG TPA: ABC transporter substrate-binding protein [Anaerolineae bacterium]|nr:ABC transporter substrate-binding protein [Anaerolineae bacterium]
MTDQLNFQIRSRIGLVVLVWSVLIGLVLTGCGAEEPKVYRVGVLSGLSFVADITDGFKTEMTKRGYIEDKNIIYDVQTTDFDMVVYQNIIQKFVEDKVDLIFVFPTEASLEAKMATAGTGIPVVFDFTLIEGIDLVDSIREPGGNITGVRYPGPDIALKRFEIMQELAPEAVRILVPYQRGYLNVPPQLEALYPVAEAAGVTLIEAPADNEVELEKVLQMQTNLDAILFVAEPLTVNPDAFAVIGKYAAEHKIPVGGALLSVDGYDSVFGVNVNNISTGAQAARLADKILRGTAAGTIPVVSAENYLQINYRAAQELGLNVDEGLLSQADEIIR